MSPQNLRYGSEVGCTIWFPASQEIFTTSFHVDLRKELPVLREERRAGGFITNGDWLHAVSPPDKLPRIVVLQILNMKTGMLIYILPHYLKAVATCSLMRRVGMLIRVSR